MATEEVKINHLMGGKRRTKNFSKEFGVSEENIKESVEKIISRPSEKLEVDKNLFDLKRRYNFTLQNETIEKLDLIQNIIKSSKKNKRVGGLKSKIIDFIINEYYEEFINEIKGNDNA